MSTVLNAISQEKKAFHRHAVKTIEGSDVTDKVCIVFERPSCDRWDTCTKTEIVQRDSTRIAMKAVYQTGPDDTSNCNRLLHSPEQLVEHSVCHDDEVVSTSDALIFKYMSFEVILINDI
jgi:hypothetical protein